MMKTLRSIKLTDLKNLNHILVKIQRITQLISAQYQITRNTSIVIVSFEKLFGWFIT